MITSDRMTTFRLWCFHKKFFDYLIFIWVIKKELAKQIVIHGCNLQDNWKAIIIDARLKPSNISHNKMNINQFTHKSQHKHIHLKKKKNLEILWMLIVQWIEIIGSKTLHKTEWNLTKDKKYYTSKSLFDCTSSHNTNP